MPSKVGEGPAQIPGTAGRFHGNPVSGNQPCKQTSVIMATRAQMQAHGKASPCGHPTDHRNRWMHWLEINLA